MIRKLMTMKMTRKRSLLLKLMAIVLSSHGLTIASLPPTIKDEILKMFIRLIFSQKVEEELVETKG